MAAAALYASDHAPTRAAAIFIRLGDNPVAVPLALKATGTPDGLRVLAGSDATEFTLPSDSARIPGGMVVDARIDVAGGELTGAVFNEATVLGSPLRPLSRVTCRLRKTPGPAGAGAKAGLTAQAT